MKPMVFHRFDDIGPYRSGLADLLGQLDAREIPVLLAVIPSQLDDSMARVIGRLKHALVFQHGCRHLNRKAQGWLDEFPAHLERQAVSKEIAQGRQMLESKLGIEICGYVPPWNNTADQTIRILEAQGYVFYSAQSNNSPASRLAKLDITFDSNSQYEPKPRLKPLDALLREWKDAGDGQFKGIMYHPNPYRDQELKMLADFIIGFGDSNNALKKICKDIGGKRF